MSTCPSCKAEIYELEVVPVKLASESYPRAIGFVCGSCSGIVSVQVDPSDIAREVFRKLSKLGRKSTNGDAEAIATAVFRKLNKLSRKQAVGLTNPDDLF